MCIPRRIGRTQCSPDSTLARESLAIWVAPVRVGNRQQIIAYNSKHKSFTTINVDNSFLLTTVKVCNGSIADENHRGTDPGGASIPSLDNCRLGNSGRRWTFNDSKGGGDRRRAAGRVDAPMAIGCARRGFDQNTQCIGESRHYVPAGICPRGRAAGTTQELAHLRQPEREVRGSPFRAQPKWQT
jgi:hypothetical protein